MKTETTESEIDTCGHNHDIATEKHMDNKNTFLPK